MILLTTLISHSLLATNPLCITTCYTNFMPLVYHEGIWSAANSIFAYYLHFKLNTQITGAALNQIYPSSWPQRVVQPGESGCGNSLICFFISLKDMVSSFWENRNKTAKLHCIIPWHCFYCYISDYLSEVSQLLPCYTAESGFHDLPQSISKPDKATAPMLSLQSWPSCFNILKAHYFYSLEVSLG